MIKTKLILWSIILLFIPLSSAPAAEIPSKLKVSSVTFAGNRNFTDRQLKKVMLTRPSGFLSRSYYYSDILNDDLENLVLFYQQNGYLEVQITDTTVSTDTTRQIVDIRIAISEGRLTRVEGVAVLGNTVYLDSLLLQKIGVEVDDPFRRAKLQEASLSLLTLYANNGYLEAEVVPDVRINSETHRALIDFIIRERNQFTIDEIRFDGLKKTKPKIVRRELLFRPGEVIQYSRLLESQRRLYLTGLFASVFVRPQVAASDDSSKKDILIELQENESIEFNVAAGYGSVEKARGRIEIFNTNWRGTARKLGLATKASFINRGIEGSFTEPWTFGIPWRTDINLLLEYLEEPGYNLNRIGARFVVGRGFGKRSTFSVTYRHERSELSHVEVAPVPEELESNIRSLTLSLIYDTRDNLFNSTRGTYAEWKNELAGSFLSGTDTFVRSVGRFKFFRRLRRSTIVGTAVEIGWMDVFGSSREIPLSERFYTGGPNSLRGFGYQLVGPQDSDGDPIGGRLKLVWNLVEIRQAVYKMIGLALFADVGNVWSEPEGSRISDLRTSTGVGLRANTPVGMVRLDLSMNLEPQEGESKTKLYFNMGQAF
jgi:outer membrane protein insertion porin family